jgi:predicted phage terminase large subunit-like protein
LLFCVDCGSAVEAFLLMFGYLMLHFVTRLEEQYSSTWQQQELEGEFCDLEGSLLKRHWFSTVREAPPQLRWFRYWDLAASTKTAADFTASACAAISKDTGDVYLRDLIKVKEEWPVVRRLILETAKNEPDVMLGVEAALHGVAAIQELRRESTLTNVSLRSISVTKDKVTRALPVASRAESGHVKLVEGSWVKE